MLAYYLKTYGRHRMDNRHSRYRMVPDAYGLMRIHLIENEHSPPVSRLKEIRVEVSTEERNLQCLEDWKRSVNVQRFPAKEEVHRQCRKVAYMVVVLVGEQYGPQSLLVPEGQS